MTTWDEAHQTARAALDERQWHQALRAIAPWLTATTPELDGAAWSAALTTLAAAAKPLGAAVQATGPQAAAAPDDPAALYDLGHALVEAKRPDLAVAILAHAVERSPAKTAALAELAAALELQGRNREVVAVLDAHPALIAAEPLLTYLRAFDAIVVADLDSARSLLPQLHAATDQRYQFMAARLGSMLARADGLRSRGRLADDDLRGWHFVLTGGVLVHDQRLDKTWDSAARVKGAVHDLALVLEALGLDLPALLHPPERNCELVARAAAALLDRPATKWYGGDEHGLLVVYDARDLIPELRQALVQHRPGQPLYMRAAEHATEQPTAPDLLGYLYERNTSPWGPGFTPAVELIDTSKIPDDELVAAIVSANDADRAEPAALREFVATLRDLPPEAAPAALRADGQRERLWVGSPVARR